MDANTQPPRSALSIVIEQMSLYSAREAEGLAHTHPAERAAAVALHAIDEDIDRVEQGLARARIMIGSDPRREKYLASLRRDRKAIMAFLASSSADAIHARFRDGQVAQTVFARANHLAGLFLLTKRPAPPSTVAPPQLK
jgi:hypothetical protein